MKRILAVTFVLLFAARVSAYNDHRGFNLDSLERVVAHWTPEAVDRATEPELLSLNRTYRDLMLGWQNLNMEKCQFYARKALSISVPRGWQDANFDAYRYVGLSFYGREQYDSALFYYGKALESVEKMADEGGYTEKNIDDNLSALYGTMGNLHNEMGHIPEAMDCYAKARAIFDKYGWNESNTVLWYNIGETWMDEGKLPEAGNAYGKAAEYARASADSLMIILAYKGLGRYYMEKGETGKALKYMREVNAYYTVHPDDSPVFRRENLEFIDTVLSHQKKQLTWMLGGCILLIVLLAGLLAAVWRLRKTRQEKAEAGELIEEALQEIPPQKNEIKLSARERDILDLLSKGYTAQDIANALGLSRETIRWYRKKLIAKFDVSNTVELVSTAKEQKLI